MKILLIFTLCLISDGGVSERVTGYSGGEVLIKCKYEIKYTENLKYFCKGSWPGCADQIKTGDKNMWISSGRFSVFDDTKSAEFRVMIRELTVQDTGTYQCGVDIGLWRDVYTPVTLTVKEDLSYEKSITKTVHSRGDLNISCKYPKSLTSDNKFLCKRLKTSPFSYKASVKESRKGVNEGNFILYDDRERQIFSVSIRNVTLQDSGEYWCGAEEAWTSDHGYKVYFTQINLTVTDPRISGSTSVLMEYSLSSLPSSLLQSTPTSSERESPSSSVIIVSVSLLVLLMGIIFISVTLHKRCKTQGRETITRMSREANGDEHESNVYFQPRQMTNQSDSVYPSLKPNTNQSDSVYQSLNLNTNQPDSVYQSLNLNTSQSDSVYQSLNLNTSQSDSVYQSLNLNINQPDSVYHSLNLNTNQPDSAYKGLF